MDGSLLLVLAALAALAALAGCDELFGVRSFTRDAPTPDGPPDSPGPIDARTMPGPLPIAYYPMDELGPAATCMHDQIGGNDGACIGGMPMLVPGRIGNAYKFDGNSYITVHEAAPVAIAGPFTVTVWYELFADLSDVAYACPVNRVYGSADANSWQFCLSSGLVIYFVGNTSFTQQLEPNQAPLSTWHHLAITYNTGLWQGWFDGVPQDEVSGMMFFDPNTMVLGLDLDAGTPNAQYVHAIDELAIYDKVLDATTIAMLAQQ